MFGAPETPAIEAMLTIEPPRPLSIIARLTAASTRQQAEHVDVEDAAGIGERVGVDRRERALEPGAVDEPADRPQAPAMAAPVARSSVTSNVAAPTSPPRPRQRSADSASCAATLGWSARITSLPVDARRAAMAAPMSPAAPVTRTAVTR